MKKHYKTILFFFFLVFAFSCHSRTVSILSWWNYLDKDWIHQETYKQCSVKLKIQEYKDTDDFKALILKYNYDLAIFESLVLKDVMKIKNKTFKKNLRSHVNFNGYPDFISKRMKVISNGLNISPFLISNTVFLYNPKNININSNDNIYTIIEKLKVRNKYPFILLDDPNMFYLLFLTHNLKFNVKNFSDMLNYDSLIVSNDYIDYPKIGVFFTWSGEALYHLENARKKGIELKILTIPKYSFVSSDLLIQLNNSKEVSCVEKLLSSKSFLNRLQQEVYYYSPYLDLSYMKINPIFKKMYNDFIFSSKNNTLMWVNHSHELLNHITTEWDEIKLNYGL